MSAAKRTVVESREAILALTQRLRQYIVGREEVIDLLAVAMVAAEPMLLLGPPGTAKSDLVFKFSQGIGLSTDDCFEYMITAFTEPSEILGPVDIHALREDGVYRRKLEGKLADARVVFLDEIFNGNSAILNTLLTVMNERKIYDAGKPVALDKLVGFFAATNEIPERQELVALKDRFAIKIELDFLPGARFDDLLRAGSRNDHLKETGQRPWVLPGAVSPEDFAIVRDHVSRLLQQRYELGPEQTLFPRETHLAYRRLVFALRDAGVTLTDREVIKLHRLIAMGAFLFEGRVPETVQIGDLWLMRYVAETREQFPLVREMVGKALGEVD